MNWIVQYDGRWTTHRWLAANPEMRGWFETKEDAEEWIVSVEMGANPHMVAQKALNGHISTL